MNVIKTLALIFSIVAVGLIGGCVWAIRAAHMPHAVHTAGRVVGIQRTSSYGDIGNSRRGYTPMYAPIVEFETAQGTRRFTSYLRSSTPSDKVGERIDVVYPEGDPDRARIDRFWETWFPMVILTPLTLVFGGVGFGMTFYVWRRRRLDRWLARFGMRVKAAYIGATLDTSISSGKRNPWRLECEWTDASTKRRYRMRSEALWQDPRPAINGGTLDVLINPADPRQYRVDVNFLVAPPRAPARRA